MNWVGGSRSRLVIKNDAKKQREFFEKRKIQQRMKNMGVSLPASPENTSSAGMDLVTLFIVNQIAAKKVNKDPPKVAVLGRSKGGSKHGRNEPLVLPMSPCSPSQLSLVESQPQHSLHETRKRKHVIPQAFKYRQLSPVLESAFSDNSASDYLPPITDPLSPFSASSASSGQGMFPLQLSLQQRSQTQLPPHYPPSPWDTSGMEQTKFQPFSQHKGMIDSIPWSRGSNPPFYQLETPSAAQVLFKSPQPDNTETRDHARHKVTFSPNQPEDREPMLDFTLDQSETEQHIEEDIFRGFNTGECDRDASYFGSGKSKIYLKDETSVRSSTPQTVPDPQCREEEEATAYLSSRTDMNFSCLEHNNSPMNSCDCSPSYSCEGGYLSTDSNADEECNHQACCADSLNPNLALQGQPRLLTPLLKPKMNFRDEQEVMENTPPPDKAIGSNSQHLGSHTAQFNSPQAQTQSSEPCKCKKTPNDSRDAATQTVDIPAAETCDASTQCGFDVDSGTKVREFNLCLPPVDVSVQHPATGRQTDTVAAQNTHTPSPGKERSRWRYTPWSKKKFSSKFTVGNSDGSYRPTNPFRDALSMTNAEGWQQEHLRKDLCTEAMEEVTSATGVNRHSEEATTLEEIADILLLLKQRKE
ncbi:hypothetical protein D9C73_025122 [Collichthys lucidus]|uniref:Uncharacterized protein n=1 Tax=Collichthys lucidus TaxID=240159 RepID=A0A4U5VRC2_COLLU|nr:hypothetical protein D9C73_025122 [Collichthys lucidus]